MKNLDHKLESVRELHRNGNFEAAKKGYLALLHKQPNNAEILHGLGIVCAQLNDFSSAVEYLELAAKYQSTNTVIQINLGNALKNLGLFNKAIDVLQTILNTYPDHSHALNNLGAVYYAQGKLEQAIQYYRHAIEQEPNYTNAYYNLGLALTKQKKIQEAIDIYKKLLQEIPGHALAHFQLACLLLQNGNLSEAISYFLLIEKHHPDHAETQINLATCFLKQGELNAAKTHYLQALKITPQDTQILYNLGVINMQQGYPDYAIQYYQRTLQIDNDHFAAHNNIGVAFLAKNHLSYALHHYREAQRLQPSNESIRYIVDMLAQNKPLLSAPIDYIQELFDAYADHYDAHLLQGLGYQIPQILLHAIESVRKLKPSSESILDLGCGTGLCGGLLKPFAASLIGVDLSSKMIEMAREKNIYDELITDDIHHFLQNTTKTYNIIIAGDVLVYQGDLSTLFKLIKTSLRTKGIFIFNCEITTTEDYKINQSGRFAHHKNYVERLAQETGLRVIYYKMDTTRQQNNMDVDGHIFILSANREPS